MESCYRLSVVQTNTYLLACSRYIEMNPVRARMVADPSEYRWSSCTSRIDTGNSTGWLDTDPCFLALGSTVCRGASGIERSLMAPFRKRSYL